LFAKLEWDFGTTIGIPVHIDSVGRILLGFYQKLPLLLGFCYAAYNSPKFNGFINWTF
jgi:hypothetical protein